MAQATRQDDLPASKELNPRQRELIDIYIQNNSFSEAFTVLKSIINSGSIGLGESSPHPSYAPLPEYLSLAATLIVHPLSTTRCNSPNDSQAANDAVLFLKDVLRTQNPINARFAQAFSLKPKQVGRGTLNPYKTKKVDDDKASNTLFESEYAQSRSLFQQTDNFWNIVGWALNCSSQHPERWDRWKLLLDIWVDFAEKDFVTRQKLSRQSGGPKYLQDSILWSLSENHQGSPTQRLHQIMRAIFANGNAVDQNAFREVFPNETKARSPTEEETRLGIMLEPEESEVSAVKQGKRSRSKITAKRVESDDEFQTFVSTTPLRCRLINLMITMCLIPHNPLATVEEFSEVLAGYIRPLEIKSFQQFLFDLDLPATVGTAVHATIIFRFLGDHPMNTDIGHIGLNYLCRYVFPKGSNTIQSRDMDLTNGVKLGLLIETLIGRMMDLGTFEVTDQVKASIEEGISRRNERRSILSPYKRNARTRDELTTLTEENDSRIGLLLELAS